MVGVGFLVIINRGEHSGHISQVDYGKIWSNQNPDGWNYQDYCGAHGQVLVETHSEAVAKKELAKWLKCDAAEAGRYCYTHNRI